METNYWNAWQTAKDQEDLGKQWEVWESILSIPTIEWQNKQLISKWLHSGLEIMKSKPANLKMSNAAIVKQDEKLEDSIFHSLEKLFSLATPLSDWLQDATVLDFLESLQWKRENARILSLRFLCQIASEHPQLVIQNEKFLIKMAQSFKDDSLAIVKEATKLITLLMKTNFDQLFDTNSVLVKQYLSLLPSSSEAHKLRIYELFVQLSLDNTVMAAKATQLKLFDQMFQDLSQTTKENNTLSALALLEVIKPLVYSVDVGIPLLQQYQFFGHLVKMLVHAHEDGDAIMAGFVMQSIGSLCKTIEHLENRTQLFSNADLNQVMTVLLQNLVQDYGNPLDTVVEAIGNVVASNREAFSILMKDSKPLTSYLKLFLDEQYSEEVSIAFRHSFSQILRSIQIPSNELRDLFHSLRNIVQQQSSNNLGTILLHKLKSPFAELRYSIFNFIFGMVFHTWGIQSLQTEFPLFIDYFIDRNTETAKEGKEWKYMIIEQMVKTVTRAASDAPSVVTSTQKQQLEVYLKRGPFYVSSHATVALATDHL